jgi:carboxyl-terminal processing protease
MLQLVMRSKQILLLLSVILVGLVVWAGCKTSHAPISAPPTAPVAGLTPGPNDPKIAFVATKLLEGYHYSQQAFDAEMSVKAFDGYVDALDPRHENFLQSDMDEFASVRTNLDVLMVGGHSRAELAPAFSIYERFVQRMVQHTAYVSELLAKEKFKFMADEKISTDWRKQPFPKDLSAAEQQWRQRLRYEYLLEKLAAEIHETNGVFTVKFPADAHTNITAMLDKRYRRTLRLMTNWSSDTVLQNFLNYGVAHAYDPHSDYFGAPKAADFSIDMNLALFGIGAQLTEDDGFCTIRELVDGGPAKKSKLLKKDDRIIAVAQADKPPVSCVDMELGKVVQMIRGQKGTEVRLTISPAEDRSTRRIVTLVRDEIKLEDREAKAQLIERPDGKRIGVIELPSFYAPVSDGSKDHVTPKFTSVDTLKLLNKLKSEKVDGIILDLRSNPGGSLEEAVRFTGLFIKEGPIVLQRDARGSVAVANDPDSDVAYEGPLVVMLNRFSASASEIAGAALQDYGRAIIVGGVATHGKGTIQQLQPLRPFVYSNNPEATNDPGMLKITKGKFYRVSGGSTQINGVNSDIILPDVLNHSTHIGEGAMENALPWDTIEPRRYDKLNLVQPFLSELQRRSLDRIATNQEFSYVRQDIEFFKKKQAEKTETLNERDAIAERERDTLKNRERDQERDARSLPSQKVYELTIKNSAEPRLPAVKSWFTTNTVTLNVQTNWAKGTAFYSTTNSWTGFSTNYFASIVADGTNAITATNQIVTTTISKSVSNDAGLDEGVNIMCDYISLLSKRGMLTATH